MANTYKITRLLTLMALLLAAMSSASAANSLYVKITSLICGQTCDLEFELTNDDPIYGMQATIQLPEGVEFETDASGNPILSLSDRAAGFSIVKNLVNAEELNIALLSESHSEISGNEGVILTAKVKVPRGFPGGNVSVVKIILTGSNNDDIDVPSSSVHLNAIVLVESITLDKSELILTEGETGTLTATVTPTYATDKTVTWTSSNTSVATVDANGIVTAIAAGEATITATAGENSASCPVTVTAKVIEVTDITLDKTELTLTEGDSETLIATVLPEDATDKTVTWSSSDETVVTVDEDGKVTAVAPGTATITASAGEKSASCTVTVIAKVIEVTEITLDKSELSLTEGETGTLTATVAPENATDPTVTWSSSDSTVASVDENGKVTAIKAGTATITATSANGKTATCFVTVAAKVIEVTEITLDKTELSLTEGETGTLTATVAPENATDPTVTWSSDNEEVATVDQDGKVTAIAVGTATITVTSANGKTATCTVTVTAKIIEVTEITLDKSELSLTEGETGTLTATVAPENATDPTVAWTSSDEAVATVDANGNVTAVSPGSATITATAGENSASCTVTVTAKVIEVTEITLDKSELSLTEGETGTLTATVLPDDATDKTVTWSSSDATVVTVDANGKVTAVAPGAATITASAGEKSASCSVTVAAKVPEAIGVTAISLDKTELNLTEGDIETLIATVLPDDATDKTVTWSSSDETVAIVDEDGKVTAVAPGTATITASAGEKSASCTVTVAAKVPEVIGVTSISLDKTELNLMEGDSETLIATVLPQDATDKTVTWSSSDETIATVDEDGKVTAVAPGVATITATAADGSGISASCIVTVTATTTDPILVESIELSQIEVSIQEYETFQLSATVLPYDATDQTIIWTSSDTNIARVNEDGLVTAISRGTAVITASAADGSGVSASCNVTVTAKPSPNIPIKVKSIQLSQDEWDAFVGETITLNAKVKPIYATNRRISWSTSDEDIATVDSHGKVTAIAEGEAVITATADDGSGVYAECKVTVSTRIPVTAITLSQTEANLEEGESFQLVATIVPEDATDMAVIWSSGDSKVATVDAEGLVTAIAAGEAVITATAADGSGVKAECMVTVTIPVPPVILAESLTITPETWSGEEGESFVIEATVLPETATDKTVVFESSDEKIATVDAEGRVTIVSEGTCVITVSTTDGSDLSAECVITGISGVATIFGNPDGTFDVFTQQGLLLRHQCSAADLKQLQPGIYIIRSGSISKKVIIKD